MKILLLISTLSVVFGYLQRCDYEGIQCSNKFGIHRPGVCEKFYKKCTSFGYETKPIKVRHPEKFSCRDNQLIRNSLCQPVGNPQCDFTGIICTTETGQEVFNVCSNYFATCDNGVQSAPVSVPTGTRCLNGVLEREQSCTPAACDFTDIRCALENGDIVETYCTSHIVKCVHGQHSPPELVPAGSQCFLHELVDQAVCTPPICDFEGIRCSNAQGEILFDVCTDYSVSCVNGVPSLPAAVPTGTKCYNNEIVNNSLCLVPQCTNPADAVICVDPNGILAGPEECTGHYTHCFQGNHLPPLEVAFGTRCRNGLIVRPLDCLEDCDDTQFSICTNELGEAIWGECTRFISQCYNGRYQDPLELPPGQGCFNGRVIQDGECGGGPFECDFFGLRCSNSEGQIVNTECTNYFVNCENGSFSNVRQVALGTKCFNGEIFAANYCDGECTHEGLTCTNYFGKPIDGRCTKYFTECIGGIKTGVKPVAPGSVCYKSQIILEQECKKVKPTIAPPVTTIPPVTTPLPTTVPPPQPTVDTTQIPTGCLFRLKCANELGSILETGCATHYVQCDHGIISGPIAAPAGSFCKNHIIVSGHECTEIPGVCNYEGIRCTHPNGRVPEVDTCTSHFVQCDNGAESIPQRAPLGVRCYGGKFIPTFECKPRIPCDFEAFRCSNFLGQIDDSLCQSHFITCVDGFLRAPQRVPASLRCRGGVLLGRDECEAAVGCDYEGLKCTNENGVPNFLTCTDYYQQCINNIDTLPQPVATGTKCLQGEIVDENQCIEIGCPFEGIQCTDDTGLVLNDQCTDYLITCNNGIISPPQPVEEGKKCLNNKVVPKKTCKPGKCDVTKPVTCVDGNGVPVEDVCTEYYTFCKHGVVSRPIKTYHNVKCYNGHFINKKNCTNHSFCKFKGVRCTDENGVFIKNHCTEHFIECDKKNIIHEVQPVAEGTACLNNQIVSFGQCAPDVIQCNFEGIRCTNSLGEFGQDNECSTHFIRCDHGRFTEVAAAGEGLMCRNNDLIHARLCSNPECSFEGIYCTNVNGIISEDRCTRHFIQCEDGVLTPPQPVAEGTSCYQREIVNRKQCQSKKCEFTGFKCTNAYGVWKPKDKCSEYFVYCTADKDFSDPIPTPEGALCRNGELILEGECAHPKCTFEGIQCVDEEGIPHDDICTNYHAICYNGQISSPIPEAAGTKCYKNEVVESSVCEPVPECSFEGLRCSTSDGVYIPDQCTNYVVLCIDGHLTEPIETSEGTRCLNDEIHIAQECPLVTCDFEGFVCTDVLGEIFNDVCTDHFSECHNGILTAPRQTALGQRCFNKEFILENDSPCLPAECNFEGLKCANKKGDFVTNRCTTFYRQCQNKVLSPVFVVPDGKKCFYNELISEQDCKKAKCNFTGKQCIDSCGDFISGRCTRHYVECINGKITEQREVNVGEACFNSEIVNANDQLCVYEYVVVESEVQGLRGKKTAKCF